MTFVQCILCNRWEAAHQNEFYYALWDDFEWSICAPCVKHEALKHDRSIFPWPEHMRVETEPYIRYREDQAVARFVLEQVEIINGKEKAAA